LSFWLKNDPDNQVWLNFEFLKTKMSRQFVFNEKKLKKLQCGQKCYHDIVKNSLGPLDVRIFALGNQTNFLFEAC
jgi:hypothetical protein